MTEPRLARARRAWERLDAKDLSLRLTLAALLLRPIGDWRFRPVFLLLAAAGLVLPGLQRRAALWLALAALAALRVVEDWPLPDNHAYLLAYWCLAAGIALRSDAPARALALNGRLLIGLVFLAASLWKLVLSPDYLSGDFMRFTWITDDRFAAAAALIGGMDADLREANRDLLAGAPGSGPALVEPAAFVWATRISSAWTVAIELAVAFAFLLRAPARLVRHRDAALVLFCVTTYAFAPVAGFAWLLIAMGVAQSDRDRPGLRPLYLASFALVLVYQYVPWLELLARWAGRL